MRILPVLLLCSTLLSAKTVITHEAMWLMKRVGAPVPSPDGKWVVFSVIEPAYDPKDQVSDLWIAPTEGTTPTRRITATKAVESGVSWSSDSARIVFASKRDSDEQSQVYLLDLKAGGEAQRITNLSTGASSPQLSPDGKSILFQSSVYPGAADDEANRKIAAERKARKYNARVYESFPIRYWDHWLDDKQTHLFVQTLEGKPRDLFAGTALVKSKGYQGAQTSTGDDLAAVWSPEGSEIIFAATMNKNVAAYAETQVHLFRIAAGGGEPRQITNGHGEYGAPKFGPDGKALFATFTAQEGKVYYNTRVAMFSWPEAAKPTVVTAKFDRSISTFAISPDSKTVYMLAEESGHETLYSISATGAGQASLIVKMNSGVFTNLAIAAKVAVPVIVANWESAVNPGEVVRIDQAHGISRPITWFNEAAAKELDWLPLEHFSFQSKAGQPIHSMLVKPPNFDASKKYPLVVMIHGGPHTMWRDQYFTRWNYHLVASPGYVLLLTNYTGSTGFGEKFAQQIQGDPLKGPGLEVNEAADEAIRRYSFIDASRQAAGGASYGGHLANWLQATTTRYKCLFSHAGLINLESQWGTSDTIYHREVNNGGPVWEQGKTWREQNPIRFAKNFKTPILLTVGENDFRVPLNQTLENWSVLQRLQIPSKLIVFPDASHWILKSEDSRFFYQELLDWVGRYLK